MSHDTFEDAETLFRLVSFRARGRISGETVQIALIEESGGSDNTWKGRYGRHILDWLVAFCGVVQNLRRFVGVDRGRRGSELVSTYFTVKGLSKRDSLLDS